ncbi:tyrosine-type recombinase/integrase [Pseudomonas kurunegalensis]|uniref:Site-specific integrase n=1 Tax=Pseudomonas kurunegalensis TaxID=485880 RepID=A0ACC5UQ70_9PSED|nr:site-specific integrase [Pseudomonas kurunegalensis]MBV4516586.1 site-specific integrase [Pseudomonas kurunegalensis]
MSHETESLEEGDFLRLSDEQLLRKWLAARSSCSNSYRVMRKEAERFVLWGQSTLGKGLREIISEDASAYAVFLSDPQPKSMWVSKIKYPRGHPEWRPFARPLNASSRRLAITQLGGLYNWMVERGCCGANPFRLVQKPELIHSAVITRQIPLTGIQLLLEAAGESTNKLKSARDRFLVALFYLTGIRTFEAVNANMNSVQTFSETERWLQVIGRRNKFRSIPVTAELYSELVQYRTAFGLAPTIPDNDQTPLLLAANSRLKRAHSSTVLKAMKAIMERAATLARERELSDLSVQLKAASTHWLRHSCFSHLAAETGNLVLVNTLAGNSSVESIARYIPVEDKMLLQGSALLKLPVTRGSLAARGQ